MLMCILISVFLNALLVILRKKEILLVLMFF